jgi:putative ABC transport system permease protein
MKKNEFLTAFFIAKKNIIKNRKALILTIIIISLGFISSITIYGLLDFAGYATEENFIETSMGHIILEPYGDGNKIENVENVIKQIKTLPNIVGVSKITKKAARLYDSNGNYVDTELYVINPEEFSQVSVIDEIISDGAWLSKGDKDKILIGCIYISKCNEIKAFDTIDVSIGEKIRLVSNGYPEKQLTLAGIYDHKFIQEEITAYINEETGKELFPDYDSTKADQIIIRLPAREYRKETVEELSKKNIDAEITDWEEKSSRNSSIIESFLIVGDLSFLIGVIISAISIYIILYINILNKKTQIGIIRAIGIKSKVISFSYVILSFFLGVIGSIVGILLTFLMNEYFKFNPIQTGIGDLVPNVTGKTFLLVSSAIIISSVVSGYIVSKKIAKQNIVEAIFHG